MEKIIVAIFSCWLFRHIVENQINFDRIIKTCNEISKTKRENSGSINIFNWLNITLYLTIPS